MCGIAGFVGPQNQELLTRMTDRIAHRGPDGTHIQKHSLRPAFRSAVYGHETVSRIPADPVAVSIRDDCAAADFTCRAQTNVEGLRNQSMSQPAAGEAMIHRQTRQQDQRSAARFRRPQSM